MGPFDAEIITGCNEGFLIVTHPYQSFLLHSARGIPSFHGINGLYLLKQILHACCNTATTYYSVNNIVDNSVMVRNNWCYNLECSAKLYMLKLLCILFFY